MKVTAAYYLMLLYITVMLKPLLPLVSDAISHTFAEAIHIATVHAIYGSNHLQKELSDTAEANTNNKHQNNNSEDQVPVHVSGKECLYDFPFNTKDEYYSYLKLQYLNSGYVLKNFPPPKFC